jgi:glycosyltransferase involved in cell wall biosynthesis
MLMLDRVRSQAEHFDVLHFHIDYLHFPLFHDIAPRTLTTLHGRQDMPDGKALYIAFDDMPLISISDDQRAPIAAANFAATIHHGIPQKLLTPRPQPRGDYLAFLGRISPEKRPDRAIAIAKAAGVPLKLAAKIDKVDVDYFKAVVAPLLDDPLIDFVGEIGDHEKSEFLGNAMALLFPIDWPEPFGIVLIEAMACGTPVIAWRRGSVAEIIEPGLTGAIVDDVAGAVAAVEQVRALDRAAIRTRFERRFTAAKMAEKHIQLYERVIASAARSADRETASSTTAFKVSN